MAAEIASLLANETKIGARRIEPRDIAVLVNNNTQPGWVQRALADYRISSVVYSAASVLKSSEARELLRVLLAVAQPTHAKIVRSALATEVFGRNNERAGIFCRAMKGGGQRRSIALPITTCCGATRVSCK